MKTYITPQGFVTICHQSLTKVHETYAHISRTNSGQKTFFLSGPDLLSQISMRSDLRRKQAPNKSIHTTRYDFCDDRFLSSKGIDRKTNQVCMISIFSDIMHKFFYVRLEMHELYFSEMHDFCADRRFFFSVGGGGIKT